MVREDLDEVDGGCAVGGAGRAGGNCGRKPADHDLPVMHQNLHEERSVQISHCELCLAYVYGKFLRSQRAIDECREIVLSVDVALDVQVFVAHLPDDYLPQQDALHEPLRALTVEAGRLLKQAGTTFVVSGR